MTLEENYNLTGLTDHEIILFVRDTLLKDLDLIKRFYPGFVAKSKNCQSRDELIDLVKETYHKAKTLEDKSFIDSFNKNERQLTHPSELDEKNNFESTSTTTTHTLFPTTSNTSPSELDDSVKCVGVWESIQELMKGSKMVNDHGLMLKLTRYSKYKRFITEIVDTEKIVNVSKAWRLVKEYNIKPKSLTTVSDLLQSLYMDGFLSFKNYDRPGNSELHIYSLNNLETTDPSRYSRFIERYKNTIQPNWKNNNSFNKNERQLTHPTKLDGNEKSSNQIGRKKIDVDGIMVPASAVKTLEHNVGVQYLTKKVKAAENIAQQEQLTKTKQETTRVKIPQGRLLPHNQKHFENMLAKLSERRRANIRPLGKEKARELFDKERQQLIDGMLKQDQADKARRGIVK